MWISGNGNSQTLLVEVYNEVFLQKDLALSGKGEPIYSLQSYS